MIKLLLGLYLSAFAESSEARIQDIAPYVSPKFPGSISIFLPFYWDQFDELPLGASKGATSPPFVFRFARDPGPNPERWTTWGAIDLGFTRVSPVPFFQGIFGLQSLVGKGAMKFGLLGGTTNTVSDDTYQQTVLGHSFWGLQGGFETGDLISGSWLTQLGMRLRLIQLFASTASTLEDNETSAKWDYTFAGGLNLKNELDSLLTDIGFTFYALGASSVASTQFGFKTNKLEIMVPKAGVGYRVGRAEYWVRAWGVIRPNSTDELEYPYVAPYVWDDYLLSKLTIAGEIRWLF